MHPSYRPGSWYQLEEASGGELLFAGERSLQWHVGKQSQPPQSIHQLHLLLRCGRLPSTVGGLAPLYCLVGKGPLRFWLGIQYAWESEVVYEALGPCL